MEVAGAAWKTALHGAALSIGEKYGSAELGIGTQAPACVAELTGTRCLRLVTVMAISSC